MPRPPPVMNAFMRGTVLAIAEAVEVVGDVHVSCGGLRGGGRSGADRRRVVADDSSPRSADHRVAADAVRAAPVRRGVRVAGTAGPHLRRPRGRGDPDL